MASQIYISCPIVEPMGQLQQVVIACGKIAKLANISYDIYYWNRGTYYRSYLDNANIFVLMLPGNSWEYPIHALPVGCKKELDTALNSNKNIYIAYKNKAGEYNIYQSTTYFTKDKAVMIKGVAGTTNYLYECLKQKEMETKNINSSSSIHYKTIRELQDELGYLYNKDLTEEIEKLATEKTVFIIETPKPDRRLLFKRRKK